MVQDIWDPLHGKSSNEHILFLWYVCEIQLAYNSAYSLTIIHYKSFDLKSQHLLKWAYLLDNIFGGNICRKTDDKTVDKKKIADILVKSVYFV